MRTQQQSVPTQIRRMLAGRLKLDESVMTDDFRWVDVIDPLFEEEFVTELSDTFNVVPSGLSLGSGHRPFDNMEPDGREGVATVRRLIAQIELHPHVIQNLNE